MLTGVHGTDHRLQKVSSNEQLCTPHMIQKSVLSPPFHLEKIATQGRPNKRQLKGWYHSEHMDAQAITTKGAGEPASLLRGPVALPEDLGLIP